MRYNAAVVSFWIYRGSKCPRACTCLFLALMPTPTLTLSQPVWPWLFPRRRPDLTSRSNVSLSAAARSPMTVSKSPLVFSSEPRSLMEASVLGCRLPRVSRLTSSASRHSGPAASRSPSWHSTASRGCRWTLSFGGERVTKQDSRGE